MSTLLTDRPALARNRARAARSPTDFLHQHLADEVKDRLSMVNKRFTDPVIVGDWPEFWTGALGGMPVIEDTDTLDLHPEAHDLVLHLMGLHWANDPVGQMVQARRALRPDGLFLAGFFGGNTLQELRASLAQAEADLMGGLSPRIVPMGEIRDLGALLQRAGFALPVADSLPLTVSYESPLHLMHDLRAMGQANAMSARPRQPMRRALLERACALYHENFAQSDGRIPATFELIFLTGWAPDASQPQPLRPGSAGARLADALNTLETPLKD